MKKQSYYNIWVKNILYNSLSDKLIQFKAEEVNDIKALLQQPSDYVHHHSKLIKHFENLGFICENNFHELDYLSFRNKYYTLMSRNCHLTINPTLECNYKCWYCCVEEQGTKYEQRRMDDGTIERVKKHIQKLIHEDKANSLLLDWFGGEPLMYFKEVILPISQYSMELCEKQNIPFRNHVTTNAYYINSEMITLFKDIHLSSFQIPIDGSERKHNSVKNTNGVGDFKKIIQSINLLCENIDNCSIILRINYDKETLNDITSIVPYIKKINISKIIIDFQRVWQVALTVDESGSHDKLLSIKKHFENEGFRTSYFAYTPKSYMRCYADNFYHRVINYDGKIYKCSARDYDESLVIGTLDEDGRMDIKPILYQMFSEATFKNDNCRYCKKLPLCYGNCIQRCYEKNIGKREFICYQDMAEISFEDYILDRAKRQEVERTY